MNGAISARGLGKTYRLYDRPADRLIEAVLRRPRHRLFRALQGVTFDVPRGRSLGIIGENGAGKSTLLKLIAGTTPATEGTVETHGAVASILELGMGFHPEFSGAENARLNAALLGLSPAQMRERLPLIREFSELGEFFDQPIKLYSSGMVMRLAFSVATHVDAEILIIDEALAVGDGYFQKKSVDRITEFQKRGGTLLFCSHAMYYVASLCQEAIWLEAGRVRDQGSVLPVVRAYESFLRQKEERAAPALPAASPAGGRAAWLTDVAVHDGSGLARGEFESGSTLAIDVAFETARPDVAVTLRIGIDRDDGVQIFSRDTREWRDEPFSGRTRYRVRLTLPEFPLSHGEFKLYVFLADDHALHVHDARIVSPAFAYVAADYAVGVMAPRHFWSELPAGAAEPEAAPQARGAARA